MLVVYLLRKFRENLRAEAGNTAGYVIMLVLTLYVMAYTLPDAFVNITNATAYGDTPTAVINIMTIVLPIMVVFAIILKILPAEVKSKIGL